MMRMRRAVVMLMVTGLLACSATNVALAKVKLTYMSWFAQAGRADVEQEIVKAFNAAHPDIEVQFVGVAGSGTLLTKLLTMTAAGTPPDVAAIDSVHGAPIVDRIATDITAFVEADHYDMDQFRPGQLQLVEKNGRIYGVPWGYGELALFYNATAFSAAGLPLPHYGWTYDEFVDAGRHLTSDENGDGKLDHFGGSFGSSSFWPWPGAYGAYFVDPHTGALGVTQPAFIKGIDLYADLWRQYGIVGGSFTGGTAAMNVAYEGNIPSWNRSQLDQSFKWGASYFPLMPGANDVVTYGHGHIMGIIKGSPHPKEAWEFIKFYTSPAAQAILGRNVLYPSTKAGVMVMATDSYLPPGYTRESIYGPFAFKPAKALEASWNIPGAGDVYTEVSTKLNDVFAGKDSAQTALTALSPKLEGILRDARQDPAGGS